ncbi:MAG: cobalamin-dependent protein [Candidatus Magnetobacterium sp. LHC-1]|uniref:Cobalamin B12-binding domain-containing protein n=1 Tax=Candidatus Magnetobacterium casense TaxID=1455061 RepID=A0ABS6S218_9BACT|nr:cobalamin-dependent protein [Candidatus Magnetobacterium casensis]MBF0606368.1 cobalamin-dependent protein [Nitrospirota bacterium]MBV6342468.1 cobalamin B12-binding domain-containing protein [Candidatus Magnetobacterium casensis]
MKVLLVQSYLGGADRGEHPRRAIFPLSLACLKASLTGHEVMTFDTNLYHAPWDSLRDILRQFSPDVVGISIRNIDSTNKSEGVFYYAYIKETLDVIIATTPGARIIAGGAGFSIFARQIMEDEPRIDYGVFLEGESVLPLLLDNFDDPSVVPNVFYRRDGQVCYSFGGVAPDFDALPLPRRSGMSVERYGEGTIGVETKRGCGMGCIYCVYGFLNGKKMRLRSPRRVVDDIQGLVEDSGVRRFTFVDSIFNVPQQHAEDICNELLRRQLTVKWSAWFSEKHLTRQFLELVVRAGCSNIIFSPDGFSEHCLRRLGKNITMRDILRAYGIVRGLDGVEIGYNFFKNPPGQSFDNFISTIAFFLKAKAQMGNRVHFEFNTLRIEPHTRLYELALSQGIIKANDNLLYPTYYNNPTTAYTENVFNTLMSIKGLLSI